MLSSNLWEKIKCLFIFHFNVSTLSIQQLVFQYISTFSFVSFIILACLILLWNDSLPKTEMQTLMTSRQALGLLPNGWHSFMFKGVLSHSTWIQWSDHYHHHGHHLFSAISFFHISFCVASVIYIDACSLQSFGNVSQFWTVYLCFLICISCYISLNYL